MLEPTSRIGVDRIDGGVAVIEVDGEHDLSNAPRFREAFDRVLGGGSAAVVDLAKATFLDSSILAALLEAGRRAEARGLGFAVSLPADAEPGIRRLISVTGLEGAMRFFGDREQAIAAARPGVTA